MAERAVLRDFSEQALWRTALLAPAFFLVMWWLASQFTTSDTFRGLGMWTYTIALAVGLLAGLAQPLRTAKVGRPTSPHTAGLLAVGIGGLLTAFLTLDQRNVFAQVSMIVFYLYCGRIYSWTVRILIAKRRLERNDYPRLGY